MLKTGCNIFLGRLSRSIVDQNKKPFALFYYQNFRISSKRCFSEGSYFSVANGLFFRPGFQNISKLKIKRPVILLSGILTFLGLKEKSAEEKEAELIMTIKKGILLIQREQYDKAEQMLHLALRLAQDENDEDGITFVYDTLANLAFETNQHEKAKNLFLGVLQRLLSKGEEQNSNKIIHISLKLAKILENTAEYKIAEQGYKFCIETLDKKLADGDTDTLALWGMSMDWYGKYLLNMNRKTESLECLKKAYEMCVKVNGVEHEQTVVLLNDLGTVSSLIGDVESAVSYFEEAKSIGDKLPEMKELAAIYINLGHMYLMREMYKESRIACQEGLKKAKSFEDETTSKEAMECLESVTKAMKSLEAPKVFKNTNGVLVN